MTDGEQLETEPASDRLEQEFDAMLKRMQDPINRAIVRAVFSAPFQDGPEAVNQYVTEKVREKFPDYHPPETTELA